MGDTATGFTPKTIFF